MIGRMDGTGYPDGLLAEEIPLKARIVQVADVYDALINDRPYREAFTPEEPLEILRQDAAHGRMDVSLVWRVARCRRALRLAAGQAGLHLSFLGNWLFRLPVEGNLSR